MKLFNLLVECVPLEVRIVLLLLNALSDRLLITPGQITGDGLALLAGFGAFECDEFLHGKDELKGSTKTAARAGAS